MEIDLTGLDDQVLGRHPSDLARGEADSVGVEGERVGDGTRVFGLTPPPRHGSPGQAPVLTPEGEELIAGEPGRVEDAHLRMMPHCTDTAADGPERPLPRATAGSHRVANRCPYPDCALEERHVQGRGSPERHVVDGRSALRACNPAARQPAASRPDPR